MNEAVGWLLHWLPVISILLSIWFGIKRDVGMAQYLAILAIALMVMR